MSELTVIMPVFNGEKFLQEAIESILEQTVTDFKLIIVDDNSNDDTNKIIKDFIALDNRISCIKNPENLGPAKSRNIGIEASKTELIALMDADDIALPTRFEKQINFLKTHPEYGVCGTWFTFFGDKKNKVVSHSASHVYLKVQMLSTCCIGNPTVMFKKSHLGKLRFETMYVPAEDYALWSQLIASTKFHNIQESLLQYRWHPSNISQTKAENLKIAEIKIKKKQLLHLGISSDNPKIDYYLNAVSLKRHLSKEDIMNTIEASKEIKILNSKINHYNIDILNSHIDKVMIRSIRNCKENSKSYYQYIKNDSGYFSKLPKLDVFLLYLKSRLT